jgi:hypothetical protein
MSAFEVHCPTLGLSLVYPMVDDYPTAELIAVAQSALRSMERRYPGYVARGRLSSRLAARRMKLMQAIIRRLQEDAEAESLV